MIRCQAIISTAALWLLCSLARGTIPPAPPPPANVAIEPATSRSASASAPAATSAPESLAAMKARLAQLKQEAATLEARIAALEAPAAEPPLITQLNALPKDLWPTPGQPDPVDKISARGKWITANVKQTGTSTFSGKVLSVRLAGGATQIELDAGKYTVWGEPWSLHLSALFETTKPENVGDVKVGSTISVSGFLKDWHYSSNLLTVSLITAKLNPPGDPPPASRP